MKKFIIGIFILGTLVVYSLGVRHEQPKIGAPSSLASNANSNSSSSNSPSTTTGNTSGSRTTYKDGTYTGSVADAYYGSVQVQATISGGKITNVKFLQYPDTHATSIYINQQAMPYLQQEAIQAQSANVNTISGATYTSQAFVQSLTSALSQA